MITKLKGDDLGVCRSDNHALYEWNGKGKVVFSATALGKGLSIHFAAEKKSLREIKPAINEFCKWAFKTFECRMIFGEISRESIARIVKKCGFVPILDCDEGVIYVRYI